MKFYSYANKNQSYVKAISLTNVRSVERFESEGRSTIRFGVSIKYSDGSYERFPWLESDESRQVYQDIIELLSKEEGRGQNGKMPSLRQYLTAQNY